MKTALVIGTTGLVGRRLVEQLLNDLAFEKVVVFARRSGGFQSTKLQEHIIDFDHPELWQHLVKGDVLFSALGTTLAKAGSKQAQYKVDYTFQYQFASAAAHNSVPVYVLVSSAGANPQSNFFYMRMKGELERDIKGLVFWSINIIKPGPLHGKRVESRPTEIIGLSIIRFFNGMGLFRKYRPISGEEVSRAMINVAKSVKPGFNEYGLDNLFKLAQISDQ